MKKKPGMLLYSTRTKANSNAATYTCSMHPEVISDKQGKCPTCGMTLVKKN